jgi:hypothetical protein
VRVALITTGQMELKALPAALQRVFPAHNFAVVYNGAGEPFPGITSARVQQLAAPDLESNAANLIRAALDAVTPAAPGEVVADFAVILDDLEVVNIGNEQAVIQHVRDAVGWVLGALRPPAEVAVVRRLLLQKVSFHLAVPMPESWFFGDPGGLSAEVPPHQLPPNLASVPDHEQFSAADTTYLADVGAGCRHTTGQHKAPWLTPNRGAHPKAYLAWLLRDHTQQKCCRYKETQEGARLLSGLDWQAVLAHPNAYPYLRALVRDLETALGPSTAPPGGVVAALTSNSGSGRVLRNI